MSRYKTQTEGFLCIEKKDGLCGLSEKKLSDIEIIFIFDGKTKISGESGEVEYAKSGDAIIIFPYRKYKYETVNNENCVILNIDVKKMGEFLGLFTSHYPTRCVINGALQNKEIYELVKNTVKICKEDDSEYRDTVKKGYITALIGRLLSMTELKKNELEKPNTVDEITDFCNKHYSEKLSLEYLEEKLHISKYYISHVINEKMGISFNDFVNSIRINKAIILLEENDKPIKEISEEVGFLTQRTFDRAFKRQKGETAREYRQRKIEKK